MAPLAKREDLCAQEGQKCNHHSSAGCCHSLVTSQVLQRVMEEGQCTYAKVGKVFGMMDENGFKANETDPEGFKFMLAGLVIRQGETWERMARMLGGQE